MNANNSHLTRVIGCTIQNITGAARGSEEVVITTDRGTLRLYHVEDGNDDVLVEDVTGDPADLIGGVVIVAEERDSGPIPEAHVPDPYGTETWTYYEIRTSRGDITLRWLGASNGYYSEEVTATWTDLNAPPGMENPNP